VKDEGTAAKRPARYLEDDEGLEVGSHDIFAPSTNVSEVECQKELIVVMVQVFFHYQLSTYLQWMVGWCVQKLLL
jgi:hypothetical protein